MSFRSFFLCCSSTRLFVIYDNTKKSILYLTWTRFNFLVRCTCRVYKASLKDAIWLTTMKTCCQNCTCKSTRVNIVRSNTQARTTHFILFFRLQFVWSKESCNLLLKQGFSSCMLSIWDKAKNSSRIYDFHVFQCEFVRK
jgi:hypothetical protein